MNKHLSKIVKAAVALDETLQDYRPSDIVSLKIFAKALDFNIRAMLEDLGAYSAIYEDSNQSSMEIALRDYDTDSGSNESFDAVSIEYGFEELKNEI